MIVLGIESSCDETGVAIYQAASAGGNAVAGLLGHRVHSQVDLHALYGGVVPELASRDHIRHLPGLVELVLADSGLAARQLQAVAYTAGPGLAGALLVGAGFAQTFAWALGIPAIAVHHLEGHLLSPLLAARPPVFPFIALLVSGGHTQLMQVNDFGQYQLLGESVDDAAGEAFDKTAKLLGLPYPGGALLEALAHDGDERAFKFPRPMLHSNDLDFSFSGLKTAVLTSVREHWQEGAGQERLRADWAASFQAAVIDVLAAKSMRALQQSGLGTLVVAGGVGANQKLRQRLQAEASKIGTEVFFPELSLCTDNGAMIAFAGAMRAQRFGEAAFAERHICIYPRWPLQFDAVT